MKFPARNVSPEAVRRDGGGERVFSGIFAKHRYRGFKEGIQRRRGWGRGGDSFLLHLCGAGMKVALMSQFDVMGVRGDVAYIGKMVASLTTKSLSVAMGAYECPMTTSDLPDERKGGF